MTSKVERLVARGPLRQLARRLAEKFVTNRAVAEWVYNASRFPKLGLMAHDTLRTDTELMKEAISRLPKDVAAERQFRISRAFYVDAKQQILPKEEWMTLDKEVPYLTKYINQVQREMDEKAYYKKKIYKPFYKIQNMM